jgi:hypothetical protein
MKKILFYTICCSSENIDRKYTTFGKCCISSMRKTGMQEKIHVLSDGTYIPDDNDPNTILIDVDINKSDIKSINRFSERKVNVYRIKELKAKIKDFVEDIEQYDMVVFFDIDMLFYKNPHEFFSSLDNNFVYVQGAKTGIETRGFCTGIVAFDFKKLPNLHDEWLEGITERTKNRVGMVDQPILIELFETKYPHLLKKIEPKLIAYKQEPITEHLVAKHYHSRRTFTLAVDYYTHFFEDRVWDCPFPTCGCKRNCNHAKNATEFYTHHYKELLKQIEPKSVYEWGAGEHTRIALEHTNDITSVEQNGQRIPEDLAGKVKFLNIKTSDSSYISIEGNYDHDVYFVGSRNRAECLKQILCFSKESAVVCLHDAQRRRYHGILKLFPYVRFLTNGFCIASKEKFIMDLEL